MWETLEPVRGSHARRLKGRFEVLVDHLERGGIAVVDGDLFGRQLVDQHVVFDALVGHRARDVEAERLQVARDDLHGGDAALFHRADKGAAILERQVARAPQAETGRVGEVGNLGRARGRDVDDARVGQAVLEVEPCFALLRRLHVAPVGRATGSVRHSVRLIERDHAVEVVTQPLHDLVEAAGLLAALGRAERGVGDEEDAALHADLRALAEPGQGHDVGGGAAKGGPIALRVLDQLVGLRQPDGLAAALKPVVHDDAGDLAALAAAGAIPEEEALAHLEGGRIFGQRRDQRALLGIALVMALQELRVRFAGIDHGLKLGGGQEAIAHDGNRQGGPVGRNGRGDGRHGGRLDEHRHMGLRALDGDRLNLVVLIERGREGGLARRPRAREIGHLGDVDAIKLVPGLR